MATIQFRRQLKFAHPKIEALKYIKERLSMESGEPLLCTYKEGNGKWGAIEVICVYKKGTPKSETIISNADYFDENDNLINNFIKINDDNSEWDKI